MSTFVSVGNATQPFLRLLNAVAEIAHSLPQPVFIQYGAAKGFIANDCECCDFLPMEAFADKVDGAELLIFHAGAGSVIHAVRAGKVPVLMARKFELGEHVDNHQHEFADALARLRVAVNCEQPDKLLDACKTTVTMQKHKEGTVAEPAPMLGYIKEVLHQHAIQIRGV